jgi:hypothetical protein
VIFQNWDEAVLYIKSQDHWHCNSRRKTSEGLKTYYCCKYSKNCDARIYLLSQSQTSAVSLFQTSLPHTHDPPKKTCGLSDVVKAKVKELYSHGVMKPKAILSSLRDAGIHEPHLRQLSNYLNIYRKKIGVGGKA